MKTILVVCLSVCSWSMNFPVAAAGEPVSPDSPAATPDPLHEEIAHLRHEYDRRRADALRPVAAEYLTRLEALQKNVLEQNHAAEAELADAVRAARETYWQEDQPELRQALVAGNWLWRSDVDAHGVATAFHGDGTVEHIGLHGYWRITGPNEVTIASDGDGSYVLRFNTSLRAFEGDRRSISGTSVRSAVETLCANIWTLRDDTLEFRRNGRLIQRGNGWEGKDWRLSEDGTQVTITFTNGNGGTFRFENGTMTHFDGTPFQSSPKR